MTTNAHRRLVAASNWEMELEAPVSSDNPL